VIAFVGVVGQMNFQRLMFRAQLRQDDRRIRQDDWRPDRVARRLQQEDREEQRIHNALMAPLEAVGFDRVRPGKITRAWFSAF
jgi:hypothetical protein